MVPFEYTRVLSGNKHYIGLKINSLQITTRYSNNCSETIIHFITQIGLHVGHDYQIPH